MGTKIPAGCPTDPAGAAAYAQQLSKAHGKYVDMSALLGNLGAPTPTKAGDYPVDEYCSKGPYTISKATLENNTHLVMLQGPDSQLLGEANVGEKSQGIIRAEEAVYSAARWLGGLLRP